MSGSFWVGVASVTLVALLFLFRHIMRQSGQHAALEEREAFQRREAEAIAASAESDRKAHERMANAKAASVGEPAQSVRERMRKRDPRTR
jgi:hypothetical protein